MQHKVNDASEGAEDAPLTFDTLVVNHTQFSNSISKHKGQRTDPDSAALHWLCWRIMLCCFRMIPNAVSLYQLLNEEDIQCGLWKKRSITAKTRAGLYLVQHGYWYRAQSLFYQAMAKVNSRKI